MTIREQIFNLNTSDKKELIKKLLLSDFWKFVQYMDVKRKGISIIKDIPLYRRVCKSLQDLAKNTMILLPRKFAKTLIVELFIVWYTINNPNSAIALFSDTLRQSKKMLKAIQLFFRSDKIKLIFGDLLSEIGNNKEILTLSTRTTTAKETNVEIYGITIPIEGLRADLVVYDDIIGVDFLNSNAIRETTFENFYAIKPTLENDAKQIYIGTRWCYDDIPNQIKQETETYNNWNMIEESIYDEDGNNKYDDIITTEYLEMMKGTLPSSFFASQYLNQPIASESAVFKPDLYKRYSEKDKQNINKIVFGVDLAVMKDKTKGDYSTIVVVGKTSNGDMLILDCADSREGLEDFYNKLVALFNKWKPSRIYMETISAFEFVYKMIVDSNKKNNIYMNIYKIDKQTVEKEIRIEGTLEPLLRMGILQLPEKSLCNKTMLRLINEEMVYFDINRKNNRDDLLDALELASRHLKENPITTLAWSF